MDKSDALVYAYLFDGKGGGKGMGWIDIQNWKPDQGVLWIHLDSENQEAQAWLRDKSGIDLLTYESLLDKETRPRNLLVNDGLLLILRGVNCHPDKDPEDMVAIRMLVTETRIITMRYRKIRAAQDIHEAIRSNKGPANASEFITILAERLADRIGDVVAEIDDKVDELEDSVLSAESYELRSQLAEIRRTCISLRRYIAPQRDVLARLLNERIAWINDIDRSHLREVLERSARFVEDIDSARERASITQEELSNRLSEQMNKAMYVLSIVAAIFLPLSLLTGLLGINVGGIPGTENKAAFWVVSAMLAGLGVFLIVWFKKIKWL